MLAFHLLLFAPAAAAATSPPPAQTPPPAPAAEKMICHLEDVGQTRIAQRICHTKAEWDQIERQTEDDVQSNRNRQNDTGNSPE